MKYAIFDWDNTVRNGYTLFSWIDYLCQKRILNADLQRHIERLSFRYEAGYISHDMYAKQACFEYAEAIKGMNKTDLLSHLPSYMSTDRKNIFSFCKNVFQKLGELKIDIYIVSGAPSFIIEKYQKEFNIKKIFAFDVFSFNGRYTNVIKSNFGYNKKAAVRYLTAKYGEPPFVGFGDSESDISFLKVSRNPFCVYDKTRKLTLNDAIFIQNKMKGIEVESILLYSIMEKSKVKSIDNSIVQKKEEVEQKVAIDSYFS